MKLNKFIYILLVAVSFGQLAIAQTAIGLVSRDWQRNRQLLDSASLSSSLSVQAGDFSANKEGFGLELKKQTGLPLSKLKIDLLPVGITLQSNSHHPYGLNDGSMIPAMGFQTQLTAGVKFTSGKFSLQIQPEFVYADNNNFEGFPSMHDNYIWYRYYKYLNQTDLPEQFGTGAYRKLFSGQSSFRFNTTHYSVGISTENLWWGPGGRNALVMTNNAPGFLHATFNSTQPFQTKIGSFEWQVIAGQLQSSNITPAEPNRVFNAAFLYQPKNTDNRYLTGAVLSWQPKWVKGLHLGATKVAYLYQGDINSIGDILPLQGIVVTGNEKAGRKAALGSLFARYIMPKDRAELYFEYGRNDKAPTLTNIITDAVYPKAFVFGLRKLFALPKKDEYIQFATEFTQLQLDDANLILDDNSYSWYTHPYVRQGYTNQGQVIGAGIGPGANSQSAEIAWVNGFKKIGLLFDRTIRNNDFYYYAYAPSGDFNRHWVDLSTTLNAQWNYKGFLFAANMALVRSINYEWYLVAPTQIAGSYFMGGWDLLNFHAQLSVQYRL